MYLHYAGLACRVIIFIKPRKISEISAVNFVELLCIFHYANKYYSLRFQCAEDDARLQFIIYIKMPVKLITSQLHLKLEHTANENWEGCHEAEYSLSQKN